MKKAPLVLSILTVAILFSCKKYVKEDPLTNAEQAETDQFFKAQTTEKYVPNELLVKFKREALSTGRTTALLRINGTVEEQVVTAAMKRSGDADGFFIIKTPQDVMEALRTMRSNPAIEYAEPNWIYTYGAVSNDNYYTNGSLWGMYGDATSPANQYGSQAGEAWALNHTGSSSVVVGIIDEGIMYNHEDLAANMWKNPGEIAGNGIDDDGNGYKDDVYGWDFDGNNSSTFDGTGDDHGTHVAGTIGAIGGNGKGVAGVNWNVKIITAKFLGAGGGTTANAIKAFDYITDLKSRYHLDLVATNNSWGGGGYSQALKDAIDRSGAAGILCIVAAGNGGNDGVGDNNDALPSYPASYTSDNIIAVAAITSSGNLASFSNYGATSVDLGAPGSGIYSTVPGSSGRKKNSPPTSSYASYSGTSMATPHVTGAAALSAASDPARGLALKARILNSTIATPSLSGKSVSG